MRPAVVGPKEPEGLPFGRLGRAGVVDRVVLEVLGQRPCPASRSSLNLAWAMSRATTSVPVRSSGVETGCFDSSARISFIGRLRSILHAVLVLAAGTAPGMKRPGFAVELLEPDARPRSILALTLRSAEQETPMPTGQEAPWRGRRTTRTSWAKYLPPNWAPMPSLLRGLEEPAPPARGRGRPGPCSLPVGGQPVVVLGRGELDGLEARPRPRCRR